jgi:hypothetical protein
VRFLGLTLLCVLPLAAAPPALRRVEHWRTPAPQHGGAPDPNNPRHFYTWGAAAHHWNGGRPRQISHAPYGFQSGGCALANGLVLATRPNDGALGDLVFLPAPNFKQELIDTGVELLDCLPATLFGRAGFLMVHRHAQVRFYYRQNKKWAVQEIYSIYTASRQSGLALADVDADGRPDIYTGNYWVRSPEAFELPWHIFAIHLHNETDDAASFSYAAWPGILIGAQRERTQTPIRLFTRPANPRQLWPESTFPSVLLDRPRAAVPFGDWAIFGHSGGLLICQPRTGQSANLPAGAVLALWATASAVYALSEGAVSVWRK